MIARVFFIPNSRTEHAFAGLGIVERAHGGHRSLLFARQKGLRAQLSRLGGRRGGRTVGVRLRIGIASTSGGGRRSGRRRRSRSPSGSILSLALCLSSGIGTRVHNRRLVNVEQNHAAARARVLALDHARAESEKVLRLALLGAKRNCGSIGRVVWVRVGVGVEVEARTGVGWQIAHTHTQRGG